jgi:hypothetical protein
MAKTSGKPHVSKPVAQNAAQLADGSSELLAIWDRLDSAARSDLLAVARGLAAAVGTV